MSDIAIKASGTSNEDGVTVLLDFGFGSINLEVKKEALLIDENIEVLETIVDNFGSHVANVIDALIEAPMEDE